MTDPDASLTDEQIQALCDRATPGPWETSTRAMPGADVDEWFVREIVHSPDPRCHPINVLKVRGASDASRECCWPLTLADAEFIAAARTLVPSLLARAQKAEAENRRLVKALQRRSEPPSEERLARLLARAGQNKKHRAWRNVAWLIRQLGAVTAERDALAARLASAEAKLRAVEDLIDENDSSVPLMKLRRALSANTTPEATEHVSPACCCDGAYSNPNQGRPFLVHPDCPTHSVTPEATEAGCACRVNEAGDVPCHNCGEYVNVRCWRCGLWRGEGQCPGVSR